MKDGLQIITYHVSDKTDNLNIKVNQLEAKNTKLEDTNLNIKAELLATRNSLMQCHSFEFKRIDYVFPSLARVQLNLLHKTVTYTEKIPSSVLPNNVRAVMISVYCNFFNHDLGSHAVMHLTFNQKGNENAGTANLINYHVDVPSNTFYYEVMLPWNADISNEVVFKLTYTHSFGTNHGTKKNENWYRVKMVGFIST